MKDCRTWIVLAVTLTWSGGCADREARGRDLYAKHGCAACHGQNGRGDGPVARTLTPPPRDFADVNHYRQGSLRDDISASILNGVETSRVMPAFSHISRDDADLLADWIVSLQHGGGAAPSGKPTAVPEPAATSGITVSEAWVRESTETRPTSSGYMVIANQSDKDVTLVGLNVERAGRAEFHVIERNGTESSMKPVPSLTIAARSSVQLGPGGTHAMLFDVNPPLQRDSTVIMTLTFSDGQTQTVRAIIRPLSAMSAR